MAQYISELDVSLDAADETKLQQQGFLRLNVNLNKGAGGNLIYIWYKHGSTPITRLQLTFNDEMAVGLNSAGYTKIPKNLNAGAGGDIIYLWYFRGSGEYDTPIVEIDVTADAEGEARRFESDWERLACNLNREANANYIHAWVRREKKTFICDVAATDSFQSDSDNFKNGFIRVDESTNKEAGGSLVFIWYRQTTDPQRALNDLNVSTNPNQYQDLQQQSYQLVNVNLNEGTGGNQVCLWYKKDNIHNPIKAITLLLNTHAVNMYRKAGVTVIERNLNEGNDGSVAYLCVEQ